MDWVNAFLQMAPQVGVSLGAGSAPFVAAILTDRLVTKARHTEALSQAEKRVAQSEENAARRELLLTEQLARSDQALANEREAKKVERERADSLADKLGEATSEFGATMVHMLGSFPQPGGGGENAST